MFGWLIAKNRIDNYQWEKPKNIEIEYKVLKTYTLLYAKFNKFTNDHFLFENDKYQICTDGVLLNSSDIRNIDLQKTLPEIMLDLYEESEKDFLLDIRGPYCGFVYNKETDYTTIFTNRVGDRPVYYYNGSDYCIASSNLNMLTDFLRTNGISITFSFIGGKIMMQYGFMVDERTMISEVNRLFPGSCLVWDENQISTYRYHMLDDTEDFSLSMDETIEKVDELFRQSIKRCFDKNLEYGYKPVADISGGMDSRMTSWVARDMGYEPFLNINYGIPGCLDFKIASKISTLLGNEFIFKNISDGSFICEIDESIKNNFGSAIYIGPTGSHQLFKELNTDNIGIRHTGTCGGTPFGVYLKDGKHRQPGSLGIAYSTFDMGDLGINYSMFPTEEVHKLYVRCFLGVTASHILVRDKVVTISPFLDCDFLDFILHVPAERRAHHKLYAAWVKKKYPKAANIPWNSHYFKVYSNRKIAHFASGVRRKILDIKQLIAYKLKLSKFKYRLSKMNSIDAVLERNPKIIDYINNYYKNNITIFYGSGFELILQKIYNNGSISEKCLVLGVLSYTKQHQLKIGKM